ncbi:MAG: hypothetical protein Q7J13_15140 [Brevundimonas sp.]|uniref:hypothetical protein n=1 Tax=Brevundimonas sp. TaxID=1871086 RepID=UPI002723D6F3|nr:hypothetical protein [Brevundimonas sp.]MDO9589248.1 hypothetical protein [Brevundimonas sp.]
MNAISPATPMPAPVSSEMAWEAFAHVFSKTNFRLQIAAFDPIRLTVEHDAAFGACFSGSGAWEPDEKAKGWVANRVLELAAAINKTSVRRLCLQIPRPGDSRAIEAFLTGLQRRIKDDLRIEISRHFDTSLSQWEEDAMAFAYGGDENPHDRLRLFNYCGLDQLVSVDAGRMAIKWCFGRSHWHLAGTGADVVLISDYKFDVVRSQRGSIVESTRARSLVARAVQVIVDEGVRRAKADKVFAPTTRASIKTDLERVFEKDGPWGLIHLVLATDRRRYHIAPPPWQNATAVALLERQDSYLFEPAAGGPMS